MTSKTLKVAPMFEKSFFLVRKTDSLDPIDDGTQVFIGMVLVDVRIGHSWRCWSRINAHDQGQKNGRDKKPRTDDRREIFVTPFQRKPSSLNSFFPSTDFSILIDDQYCLSPTAWLFRDGQSTIRGRESVKDG